MTFICNAHKNATWYGFLITAMQSYLSFEGRRFVVSPSRSFFFLIENSVSCQQMWSEISVHFKTLYLILFAFCLGDSSLAVNIWIEDLVEHFASSFVLFVFKVDVFFDKNKGRRRFCFGGSLRAQKLFEEVCVHTFFGLLCKFTSHCVLMYWGEGDVWWGVWKRDALSMDWARLLCFSIICIRVVHVI